MTKEERDKVINIMKWLHDNDFLFKSTEEDVKYATKLVIQTLEQQPCEDAISRQDALRAFMYATNGERLPDYDCDNYPVTYDLRCIKKTLRALPPVTPQPKTGHWIYKQYDGYPECGDYHCSECDKIDNRAPAYCPHCGCAMIEPQERRTYD